jgi:DNA-binding CsgD family transcriptional regulator
MVLAVLQARIHARAGRFDAALERATRAVADAEWAKARSLIPYARLVLTEVTLRLGDLGTAAASLATAAHHLVRPAYADVDVRHAVATLHLAEATDGAAAAGERLSRDFAALAGAPTLIGAGPTTAAWLARLALAAGNDQLAACAASTARRLATANPGVPGVETAAMHAEAVLYADPDLLSRVGARHTDPWSRARALEDRATVLAERTPAAERRAVADAWGLALAGYRETGARGDEIRIEATLRRLGRRRGGGPDRAAGIGWPQLTAQEAAVADLVSQGLTNQGAARQLHLSPHTVNFHLRTIFRKLGIRSRVELARLHGAHSSMAAT